MPARVSVVMAVYNGERFLREALDSVLGQTVSDFEFVILNDGSTDTSWTILEEYRQRDNRIVTASQENAGIAAALNTVFSLASSDLIAHIDQDDRALPTWLEKQLAFLGEHDDCSVVSSYAYFIDTAGKRMGVSRNAVDVDAGRASLEPSRFLEIIHSTVLIRKEDFVRVGGYRKGFFGAEDRDLWGRMVTSGFMIRCNPEPLVEYRLHGGSATLTRLSRTEKFSRRGIDMNVVRRLEGKRELTSEEVEQWYEARSLSEKMKEYRRVASSLHFRSASRHYAERRWLKLCWALGVAILLRPAYVVKRVLLKFRVPARSNA